MAATTVGLSRLENTTMTISVVYTRGFKIRLWIAARLMAMAGRILGADVDMDEVIKHER